MPALRPAPIPGRVWAAWLVFCTLLALSDLQERWRAGLSIWPWPVVDELVAFALATAVAVWRWRQGRAADGWLAQPRQWFWLVLRWTPLVALGFVAALYGVRHALRAAFGLHYGHPPWVQVFVYEGLKFSLFYLLFVGVQYGMRSHRALTAARLRAEQLERLGSEARLAQLTQQMQPHFLFNALNTIAALVHDDPTAADAALVRLSALLRAATDAAQRPQHTLAEELALARSYAELMQQRFGAERVQLHWQLPEPLPALQVPVLSLQPLLENCFVHAVEPRAARTTLTVHVQRQAARLRLQVRDDGEAKPSTSPAPTPGIALVNLRERLQALYGPAAQLTLQAAPAGGHVATLDLPAAP